MSSSRYTPALGDDRRTGNVCHICCKTMGDTTTTSCGHTFCSECLTIWMTASNSCPICKQQLITAQQNQGRANLTTQANPTTQTNPTTQDDDDGNCPICMGPMVFPKTTKCGHTFCYDCLSNWTTDGKQDTCPYCRQSLSGHIPGQPQNAEQDLETARRAFEAHTQRNRNARRGLDREYPRQSRDTRRVLQNLQNYLARRRMQAFRDSYRDFDHAYRSLRLELGGAARDLWGTFYSISRITDVLNYESEQFCRIFKLGPMGHEVNHLSQEEVENVHLALIPLTEECVWLTNQMDSMSAALRDAYNATSNHRRRRYEARYDEARDELIEHIANRQASVVTNGPLPDELIQHIETSKITNDP